VSGRCPYKRELPDAFHSFFEADALRASFKEKITMLAERLA
jgi:hypothetical protein